MKLIIATNNSHKLEEIRSMLDGKMEVLSLNDIGLDADIEENGTTIRENSHIKAAFVANYLRRTGYEHPYTVIADDTGLLVEALDGEPGVHTARYAGKEGESDSEANMRLLLKNLEGKENRRAWFYTVITMMEEKVPYLTKVKYFAGKVGGTILTEKHGSEGFGYDPVFMPDGYDKSFAELGAEIKNRISHRAKAVKELVEYLSK